MILPTNGRIIIVDDKITEAQPLMNILSQKRIPFNYYTGTNASEFPVSPDDNKLRVLFLDLNIFELNKDPKTVISSIHSILDSTIPNSPNPYLLVIWSKQSNEYKIALEDHFVNFLPKKSPAQIIFLQKNKYFDYDVEKGWLPQPGSIEKIEEDLASMLGNISLFKNLIIWENLIHQHSCETVNEFTSFNVIDKDWDKNSKAIMYRLAKAIVGNDDIDSLNDEQKLAKAFLNLNSFLADKLENDIESMKIGSVTNVTDSGVKIDDILLSAINSKLHTSNKPFSITNFEQGNVYQIDNEENMIEKIIWEKKFKEAERKKILASNPELIQLDITPVCDYSQDKRYVRLIYGVILNQEYKSLCNSQYYYVTPVLRIEGENKFILIDFRQIKTIDKDFITNRGISPTIKLRREICTDIQSHLSNQINRPGISTL